MISFILLAFTYCLPLFEFFCIHPSSNAFINPPLSLEYSLNILNASKIISIAERCVKHIFIFTEKLETSTEEIENAVTVLVKLLIDACKYSVSALILLFHEFFCFFGRCMYFYFYNI